MSRPVLLAVASLAFFLANSSHAQDWIKSLDTPAPGRFAPPPTMTAKYRFGWSGIAAAEGDVSLKKPDPNHFFLEGNAKTIGVPRTLWKFDATYSSRFDARGLRCEETVQKEIYRAKTISSTVRFGPNFVVSNREITGKGPSPGKDKKFKVPSPYDMISGLYQFRSTPLRIGEKHSLVVFAGGAPYLANSEVLAREKLHAAGRDWQTIRVKLDLRQIASDGSLKPVSKFRNATVWFSDDPERLMLRVESQIFIGSVFAELRSVQFTDRPQPTPLPAPPRK